MHFLGGCSESIFYSLAEFSICFGNMILLPFWYLVCGRMMICFKCLFILPRRIFVSTPPLRININIKPPARQEVGCPSQIGIQSSSFAADANTGLGIGLGLGRGLGPVGRPLPHVHVRVIIIFVNSGEEPPPRCGPC